MQNYIYYKGSFVKSNKQTNCNIQAKLISETMHQRGHAATRSKHLYR